MLLFLIGIAEVIGVHVRIIKHCPFRSSGSSLAERRRACLCTYFFHWVCWGSFSFVIRHLSESFQCVARSLQQHKSSVLFGFWACEPSIHSVIFLAWNSSKSTSGRHRRGSQYYSLLLSSAHSKRLHGCLPCLTFQSFFCTIVISLVLSLFLATTWIR